MADVFTLQLQVEGTGELVKLEGAIKGIGRASQTTKSQLEAAAKQTKAIERGFSTLAAQFKSSFDQLAQAIKGVNREMGGLDEAAKEGAAGAGKEIQQVGEKADKAAKSVRLMRAELQRRYETNSLLPTDPSSPADLRAAGVQLRPNERVAFAAAKQERALSLKEAAAEARDLQRIQIGRFRMMSSTLAAQQREEAQADRQSLQALGRKLSLQVGMLRDSKRKEAEAAAAGERAIAQIQVGRFRMMASTLAARQRAEAKAEADSLRAADAAFAARTRLQVGTLAKEQADRDRAQRDEQRSFGRSLRRRVDTFLENKRLETEAARSAAREQSQIEIGRFRMQGRMLEEQRRQRVRDAREAEAEAARVRTLQNTALDRDAQFGGFTPQQQLARVERAQRRIGLGSTDENDLRRRFGSQALAVARDTNASATLRAEVKALEDAEKAQRAANRAKRDSEPDSVRARVGVIGLAGAYDHLHATLRGGAGAMGAIWLTWGKQLTALWAGFAAVSALKQSIQQFAAFENTLATIGAIAGESGQALAALGDSALEMSRKAIQGPQEVIDTLRVMTQAGLSAKDSLGQLRTVLDFATVGEMKPEAAAQSLVGITSAFNFPVDQMGRVGDVIAKAAAISQTSIENMTSSIKVSSVVAEQYGAKIEDVGAILAVLAKRNIDATSAGTALRNAYTEIYTPTDKAKKALDSLGLSAYDANTKQMKPFIQVMGEMREAVIGLDKQSQNAFFQIIFGERGGKVGSALLNDMQGLEKAMRDVANSTNFVDEAAIRMQDSLQNKATIALNNLKASLIEAGAAAEGPLREVLDTMAKAFADPAFIDGVKTLAANFGAFVKVVVDNADLIAKAFAVYISSRAISGMFEMGRAITGAAVAKRGLAEASKDGTFSVAKLVDGAALASTTFGGLVGKLGAVGPLVAGAGGAFLRFLGPIGLALTAVELASFAWDKYATSKAKALNAKPDDAANEAKTAQEILKREEDRIAALENTNDLKRLGAKPEDEQMNVFQRRVRDAQKLFDEAKGDEVKATRGRQLGTAFAELTKYEGLVKRRRALEDANKLGQDLKNTLPSGTLSKKFDEATGGAGRSYTTPIGTEQSNMRAFYEDQYRTIGKAKDRELALLNLKRQNALVDEEDFYEKAEQITEAGLKGQLEYASKLRDELLPGQRDQRLADIDKRYAKNSPKWVEQMRAAGAEFMQLWADANRMMDEAQAAADNYYAESEIKQEGRLKKRDDALQRLITDKDKDNDTRDANRAGFFRNAEDSLGFKRQVQEAKDALNPLTDLERELAQNRLRVEKEYAAEKTRAYVNGFSDYYEDLVNAEQAQLELVRRYGELKAQAMADPLVGVRSAAARMLGETQNIAEQTGRAFENAFGAAEQAVLDFVRTGKFSMRSLADSIFQDMARMGMSAAKSGILKLLMGGVGGSSIDATIATASVSNGLGGFVAALHTGGVVGSAGRYRSVPMSWFHNAPRYHSGGKILGGDEVPIIARKGERMLTESQNRAYESGGGGVTVNQTINVQGGASTQDVVRASVAAKQSAINALTDAQRRGRRRP